MLCMQCKLQSSMNKEFEKKLGHLDYMLSCRASTFDFIFPFYDGVILIITDKEISIQSLSGQFLELINNFEFDSKDGYLR